MWITDGTEAGTIQVLNPDFPRAGSLTPFATLGSTLLFKGSDALHGQELWRLNLAAETRNWELYE